MAPDLSVCIFGSQARQTADALSDRDVLVVGSASPSLDRTVAHWRAAAWNVSVLSRGAFQRLADVRSLFIQHLKQEGRIVRDRDCFLSRTLEGFEPKCDYVAERNDALRQVACLPRSTGAYWHDLCLADVTYVLFRNAAILHLASAGEYCFHYDTLAARMGRAFGVDEIELSSLFGLRDLKHGYRRRDPAMQIFPHLDDARTVIERITRQMADLSKSAIANGDTTNEYFTTRMDELRLVVCHSPLALDALTVESELYPLWQRIRGGGGYPDPKGQMH